MKGKKGLIIFLVILALVIGLVTTVSIISVNNSNAAESMAVEISPTGKTKKISSPRSDYVAVLYIEGTITTANATYNQEWILNTIEHLKNDNKNKGIMLFMNSGGGAVYQADEVYLALQDYKTTGKKLHAYMGPMAASGAYYIPCAADHITANRNTLTGSIGVLAGTSIDLTEFMADHGIKMTTVHAGKNKNMMNYNEPFTAEQQAIMQSVADECYEQFTNIVSVNRNIPLDELLPLCDGRVFTAKQALENGLIDEINNWGTTLERFKCDTLGNPNLKVVNYRYERKKSFYENMLSGSSKLAGKQTVLDGIPVEMWEELNQIKGPAYLYRP